MMEIPHSNLDERLRAAILAVLSTEVQTAGADLRVGVLHGIVHLAGSVDSLDTRTRAEELVQNIDGVRGVVNRIEAPGGPNPAREINLDLKNPKSNHKKGSHT